MINTDNIYKNNSYLSRTAKEKSKLELSKFCKNTVTKQAIFYLSFVLTKRLPQDQCLRVPESS